MVGLKPSDVVKPSKSVSNIFRLLFRVRKGIQLLKFCQYYYFILVMKTHGRGTPRRTSQENLVPVYVKMKVPYHGRRTEYTRA